MMIDGLSKVNNDLCDRRFDGLPTLSLALALLIESASALPSGRAMVAAETQPIRRSAKASRAAAGIATRWQSAPAPSSQARRRRDERTGERLGDGGDPATSGDDPPSRGGAATIAA